jgi:O-antigen/teichoic acid export membrane protein
MLLVTGLQVLMGRMDVILLGALRGTSEAGVYSVALRVATLITFGLDAVLVIASPLISELHAKQRKEDLQHAIRLIAWGMLAYALPVFLGIAGGGWWLLSIFGEGFTAGRWTLTILAGGQLVDALCGPVNAVLMMTGHAGTSARILTATALLNLVLNLALVPWLGMEGAAIAAAGTKMTWNVILCVYVRKTLGLRMTLVG